MAFRDYVVPILVFVVAVAAAFAGFQIADAGSDSAARTSDEVVNETISQQVDVWQFVNKATDEHTAGFNESVTVYNNSGTELTKGTDYEWNASEGTILYHNTASVNDNTNGNITYTYFENTEDVKGLTAILKPVVQFVGHAPYLIGGFALALILIAFAVVIAKFFANSGPQTNR